MKAVFAAEEDGEKIKRATPKQQLVKKKKEKRNPVLITGFAGLACSGLWNRKERLRLHFNERKVHSDPCCLYGGKLCDCVSMPVIILIKCSYLNN